MQAGHKPRQNTREHRAAEALMKSSRQKTFSLESRENRGALEWNGRRSGGATACCHNERPGPVKSLYKRNGNTCLYYLHIPLWLQKSKTRTDTYRSYVLHGMDATFFILQARSVPHEVSQGPIHLSRHRRSRGAKVLPPGYSGTFGRYFSRTR
jgi:hypothetical protein